ncbi:hypothetical protein VP1G_02224 [Cytospora mali]|uniref:Uncharacterized protein n=1 Tax=Cytospora mali TaxID=578113 RepID=A0A194UT96_CYTMA|nr:hypothetical protein VP1G_02224 [Valsa mali var. pyri (nom. inval.)]
MAVELPSSGSNHIVVSLDKSDNAHHAVEVPKRSKHNSTEFAVDTCNRAYGLLNVAVSAFCHCSSRRRKVRQTPRTNTPDYLEDRASGMKEEFPMPRLVGVLSKLRPRRRKLDVQGTREVSEDRTNIQKAFEVKLGRIGVPSRYGVQDLQVEQVQDLNHYEPPPPRMETQLRGPVPAYSRSELDISVGRHYGADTSLFFGSVPSFQGTNAMPSMPLPTMPSSADRQSRRFNLPPPLINLPHATSVSSAGSRSDAAFPHIPYTPYDYYSPHPASSVPSSSIDDFAPNFGVAPRSLHSSKSNRSDRPPRSPISSQSTGPAPSMSRSSISTGNTEESRSLPPPTPTYRQSQRAPIDSDNIVCLGPLPDNILLPTLSPKHIRFQPQSSRPTPRAVAPEKNDHSLIRPTTRSMSPIQQDPLLHDSSPLPPYRGSVTPTFTRGHSPYAYRDYYEDSYRKADPRRSTDSLGSNFTVEEEARIQEQIVKNLSMLGQERVGGEGDIVHIPQPSERRFSFEDDR